MKIEFGINHEIKTLDGYSASNIQIQESIILKKEFEAAKVEERGMQVPNTCFEFVVIVNCNRRGLSENIEKNENTPKNATDDTVNL